MAEPKSRGNVTSRSRSSSDETRIEAEAGLGSKLVSVSVLEPVVLLALMLLLLRSSLFVTGDVVCGRLASVPLLPDMTSTS